MNVPEGRLTSNTEDGRTRASLACSHCRQRKIKCSGGQPCKRCDDLNRSCQYARVTQEENLVARARKAAQAARRAADSAQATGRVYEETSVIGPIASTSRGGRGRGRPGGKAGRARPPPGEPSRSGSSVNEQREGSDASSSRLSSQDTAPYLGQASARYSPTPSSASTGAVTSAAEWQSSGNASLAPVDFSRPISTPWSSGPTVQRPQSSAAIYGQQQGYASYIESYEAAPLPTQPTWGFGHHSTQSAEAPSPFPPFDGATAHSSVYHSQGQDQSRDVFLSPAENEGATSSVPFGLGVLDNVAARPRSYGMPAALPSIESRPSSTTQGTRSGFSHFVEGDSHKQTPTLSSQLSTSAPLYETVPNAQATGYSHPSMWNHFPSQATTYTAGLTSQGSTSLGWTNSSAPTQERVEATGPQYYASLARGYTDPVRFPGTTSNLERSQAQPIGPIDRRPVGNSQFQHQSYQRSSYLAEDYDASGQLRIRAQPSTQALGEEDAITQSTASDQGNVVTSQASRSQGIGPSSYWQARPSR